MVAPPSHPPPDLPSGWDASKRPVPAKRAKLVKPAQYYHSRESNCLNIDKSKDFRTDSTSFLRTTTSVNPSASTPLLWIVNIAEFPTFRAMSVRTPENRPKLGEMMVFVVCKESVWYDPRRTGE